MARHHIQSTTLLVLVCLLCSFLLVSDSFVLCMFDDYTQNSWDQVPVQSKEMIASINQPGSSWQAVEYPQFKGKNLAQITNLLGALNVNENDLKGEAMDKDNTTKNTPLSDSTYLTLKDFPAQFDAREQWPQCIRSIKNQKNCGSCWAFSASSVLADRFCIKSGGKVNVDMSPQFMLSCSGQNNGCNGGFFAATWRFLVAVGTVSEACVPYVSFGGLVPACNVKSCGVKGQQSPFYKASSARQLVGMLDIMADLKANGPAQVAMGVYRDFYSYKSGVYHHVSGRYVGGHAVKIVGWGYDSASKLPYWICANSWGEDWGIKGYFWILRGRGECGIGKMVWSGKPAL